ncbi:MAG: DNA alkylation repair protein [Prevotella sp.]|nr:DNA alkylation repair protein [Prevotella sp.]
METDIQDTLKQIKRSFHTRMNGVASQSMRQKGLDYKVNWGVALPHLREMAAEYQPSYSLAVELWKENIRECKILATMLMPPAEMPEQLVELWIEQTKSQEIAEMAVFNLYQHLDYAPQMAFRWIASDDSIRQLSGYQLLACLFGKGLIPDTRGVNEYIDQVKVTLEGTDTAVSHAAMNSVNRFCQLGPEYEQIASKALSEYGF